MDWDWEPHQINNDQFDKYRHKFYPSHLTDHVSGCDLKGPTLIFYQEAKHVKTGLGFGPQLDTEYGIPYVVFFDTETCGARYEELRGRIITGDYDFFIVRAV